MRICNTVFIYTIIQVHTYFEVSRASVEHVNELCVRVAGRPVIHPAHIGQKDQQLRGQLYDNPYICTITMLI